MTTSDADTRLARLATLCLALTPGEQQRGGSTRSSRCRAGPLAITWWITMAMGA